ncbi:unnamed protein product (macronuclear) [Paramecium tetraurelia]|uniref:EF-hand domain-containing protein n=1 Tax=Paramecium tetraurelia TaxID=5888 RepID=A0E8V6_PARTE|nr:uncharacterized protein GSPATT00024454001 [Paramecium tetraurelia]CAK91723.1 unnamed protein product [Paramecium tetraurelia]|eukprot:XP_001459120.1 hypothetical protein (macronuclear) [Paramecium tetraurelia strain d4-2]
MLNPTVTEADQNQQLEQKLIIFLRIILNTEKDAEDIKVTLAENTRFDVSEAFRTIDANSKGYLTASDIFRFMCKNGYSLSMKFCDLWISIYSSGNDKLSHQKFLEFLVPRYNKSQAMQLIMRKLQITEYKLSFYLEDFVAKLIYLEVDYLKVIEIEKMGMAQSVKWKFNTIFKIIAGNQSYIDKRSLDQLLNKFEIQSLSPLDYSMFLNRFVRKDNQIIQRDDFSDAMFPSRELMLEFQQQKDGFNDYVLNQNQQLDQLIGVDKIVDKEDFLFKPEDHKMQTQTFRKELESIDNRIQIQKPQELPKLSSNRYFSNEKSKLIQQKAQVKSKKYQSPYEYANQFRVNDDLLQEYEMPQNYSQLTVSQGNVSSYVQNNQLIKIEEQSNYSNFGQQPKRVQYFNSRL